MFTGLVKQLGVLQGIESRGDDVRVTVAIGAGSIHEGNVGDSIAVNGACLTIVDLARRSFAADVSQETLRLTTLGKLQQGARVNLEQPLTLASPLGGHLMLGHVDGVGYVEEMAEEARSMRLKIRVPRELARYTASKGSIGIDGVSLTINAVEEVTCDVNIIPHTLHETVIQYYRVGSAVNIEADMIARYLERLVQSGPRVRA